MSTELEWKYAASPSELEQAEAYAAPQRVGDVQMFQMRTSYYDTPDGALAAKKWMLRVRRENDDAIVCCKTPLAGGVRGEWEILGDDPAAALPELVRLGAPEALLALEGLRPVCGAAFVRRASTLCLPDGTVCELACDLGELFGPSERLPLCEVELEHKTGDPAASRAFADRLATALSLQLEPASKAQRARSLR